MTKISGIPVKHYGETIGSAKIADDGTIEMVLTTSQDFGKDLFTALEKGTVDGLSVAPSFVASEPKKRPPVGRYNSRPSTNR